MRKLNLVYFILLFALLLSFGGCKSFRSSAPKGGTTSLEELEELHGEEPGVVTPKSRISAMRADMIRDEALSIGAQAGLAWKAKIVDVMLQKHSDDLDRIFNFNAMLLEHNVLPPVLVEGQHTMNLASNDVIRVTDRTYQIKRQATFVSGMPNWRTYLLMEQYAQPEIPHKTLLPRNPIERKIWRRNVAIGWQQGLNQADGIFEDNLARLTEEMRGMVLYRTLLAQHMVSEPFVAKKELGITGDGNQMSVNDQVLQITALPMLNTHSEDWTAAVTKEEADPNTMAQANNQYPRLPLK